MKTVSLPTHLVVALNLCGLVGIASLLAPTASAATPAKKIKVLGMQIEGNDLSNKDKADLFKVVQTKLRSYPQVSLLKPPPGELTDEMIDLECIDIDAACLRRLGKKYKAEQVFYSQVDKAKGGKYKLLVWVIDVATGKALHDETSNVSSFVKLANALEKAVAKVFGKGGGTTAPKPNHGFIKVKTNLKDAKIFIDKSFTGLGEIKEKRKIGKYTVEVKHDGYATQLFTLEVTAGRTTTRSVTMKGVGIVKPKNGDPKTGDDTVEVYETWWFWTIIGVVVIGATTGIVVAATSGEEAGAVGNVTFSVDPQQAWRDFDVLGGTP